MVHALVAGFEREEARFDHQGTVQIIGTDKIEIDEQVPEFGLVRGGIAEGI